ncbi:MAG: PorV/PorQ family protein [Candidatus Marinimicrobia bacterium]|nr:PorV/PorQ family protein [Candidatus Neomarinimicrobiota bacterium]
MNKIIKIILILLFGSILFGQDQAGGSAGAYLRMSPDARAAALGNATTSISDDVNMTQGNPASIPSMEKKQFSSSFQFLSLDRSYQTLAFGVALPPSAGMTVTWIHAGVDGIDGRNYSNDYTYEYTWSQNAFIIGFGLKITDWLSLGVSGKVLSDQLVNSVSSGFSADVGVKLTPVKNLELGFVLKDVSGKSTWDTSAEPYVEYQTRRVDYYPTTFHFGISYLLMDRFLFTGAYKYSEKIEPTWHMGVEARIWDAVYVRAGADDGSPAFGIGTTYKLWNNISTRMDYAFLTGMLQEGSSHLFTWLFYF